MPAETPEETIDAYQAALEALNDIVDAVNRLAYTGAHASAREVVKTAVLHQLRAYRDALEASSASQLSPFGTATIVTR